MRLFGKIQELTKVLWRKNGKEVELTPVEPTVSTVITIPDPGDAADEMVLKDTAQTLTNKTLNADDNTVSNLETDNLKAGVLNTASDLTGASDTQIPSALAVTSYVASAVAGKDDASEITYTPGDLTDWNGSADPGNVDDGLDQLADRVKTQEGRIYDASEVTYTPSALANWNGSADPGQTDDALDQLAARLKTEETKVQPASLGGTGQTVYAEGDFLIGNGATTLSKLPIGATGRFLLSNGTTASWTSTLTSGAISADDISFATTKGIQSSAASSTLNVGTAVNTTVLNIGNSAGVTNVQGAATFDSVSFAETDVVLAGPTLTLDAAYSIYRLQGGFGPELTTVSAPAAGRQVTVVNETSAALTVTNGTIITGTGADLVIENGAAITLLSDGTNWNLIGGAGGGGGLGTEVVSSNVSTAVNNTHYLVNCSGGPITITLPASPQPGSVVRASDESGTSATNNITFAGNGNLIDGDSSFIIDVDNGWAQLMWTGTEWTVDTLAVNADIPTNVVTTDTVQTITAAKTFSSALTITPTTNQLILGTTNTTTISATAPSASRVYTIPDAGGNADFVLTAGAQTIGGAKTFSASTTLGAASDTPYTTYHTLNKNFSVGTPSTATDANGGVALISNAYTGNAAYQNTRLGSLGGGALFILPRTGDTSASLEYRTNLAADGTTTSATTKFAITQAGAVTLGPSSFTGQHSVNGAINLENSTPSAVPNGFYRSTTGSLIVGNNSAIVGTVTSAGAWTFGASGAVDAVIKHTSNGRFKPGGDNTYTLGESTNRWIAVYAVNGSIITTSDSRLKENITPIESTLNKVAQLMPSRWESKYETYDVGNLGFIADEVEPIFPELVSVSEDTIEGHTNIKQLDMGGTKMIAILVKAIQELNAKLEAAEQRIAQLEGGA